MYSSIILCIISSSHKNPNKKIEINFQIAGTFSCLYTVVSALFIANVVFTLLTVILFCLDLKERQQHGSSYLQICERAYLSMWYLSHVCLCMIHKHSTLVGYCSLWNGVAIVFISLFSYEVQWNQTIASCGQDPEQFSLPNKIAASD